MYHKKIDRERYQTYPLHTMKGVRMKQNFKIVAKFGILIFYAKWDPHCMVEQYLHLFAGSSNFYSKTLERTVSSSSSWPLFSSITLHIAAAAAAAAAAVCTRSCITTEHALCIWLSPLKQTILIYVHKWCHHFEMDKAVSNDDGDVSL